MIKTKTWIILFAVMLILCLIAGEIVYSRMPQGNVVEILQDGNVIRTIDLSRIEQTYTLEIKDEQGGSNLLLVEPGRICVKEADCPDLVCVHRGWLSNSAAPIVCIPHRLVIRLQGESEIDALVK